MIILGIETSCDETAAAVVKDGRTVLSSIVASQAEVHRRYGGVVPELASRKHLEAIVPVVNTALETSGILPDQLDAVAVTQGPGLVGALLVGFSFAKAFAFARGLPWTGVSHLDGHIHSVVLAPNPPPFPFAALLASGGHTAVYYVASFTDIRLMGQTRDDAAGEAFDKVAKMLDLGYPGGVSVSRLAEQGNPRTITFPRTYLDKNDYDFSFSGIKTAVSRYIQTHAGYRDEIPDIAAGFQESLVDVLSYKLIRAAEEKACGHIAIVGGVAANRRLREKVLKDAAQKGLTVHIPRPEFCGDNAAMIAAAGYHCLIQQNRSCADTDVYSRIKSEKPRV